MSAADIRTPDYWAEATRALSRADPTLKKIIATYKGETLTSRGDMFYTLARSITGQQISVKAADSLWDKLSRHLPQMHPVHVLAASTEDLRACGLSQQKIAYLRHIAEFFSQHPRRVLAWNTLPDGELLQELTALKGVGNWTAQMLLIF